MTPQPLATAALGVAQILGWGSSLYFPAVLAAPIVADTGWPLGWVVGGVSIGLLVAGLIAPRVGAVIDRSGGRPVLAMSSLLFALGLAGIGTASTLPAYLLGWAVLGGGMGTGLYDAVFAALGKLYGANARKPITNLTLIGGLASTVCWPSSAYLAEMVGWRGACLVYAALHLLLSLPLQMAAMPALSHARSNEIEAALRTPPPAAVTPTRHTTTLALLAVVLTIGAGIGSIVAVHLLIFLQAIGASSAAAVALGTLFGPAQLGARAVERFLGERYHPIWTMVASCTLMALGLVLLLAGTPLLAVPVVVYASGFGIMWIARGTLPLALFGAGRYGTLMGRLAFPSLVVQALAPSAGALLIERSGVLATITTLSACAIANVALVAVLWLTIRRPGN